MINRRTLLGSTAAILAVGKAHASITDSNGNPIVTSPGTPYTFTGLNVSGSASPTITISSVPSSGNTSSTLSVGFTYTGAAPSGLTAVWQTGAITATVTGFTASGGSGSATVSTPATAATYTLHITGTGSNTATATAPNTTAISTVSATGAPWPGQPGNTVGFAGAPGFTGNGIMTNFTGSFADNTTYTFKIFDAGSNQSSGTNITASGVQFVGCYFGSSSSSILSGIEQPCTWTGSGTAPTFNYCTFAPSPSVIGGAFPPTPANFTAWPTGSGNACTQAQGYDYGPLSTGGTVPPTMNYQNCDFWGWGNGNVFDRTNASNPITFNNCWIHDPRNSGGGEDHQDGVGDPQDLQQFQGIQDFVEFLTVNHCTIACVGDTQNLAFQFGAGPSSNTLLNNITITNNYWAGNETNLAFGMVGLTTIPSNFVFTGNVIGPTPMTVGAVVADTTNALFTGHGNLWRNNTILPGNYNGDTGTVTSGTPFIWPDNLAHATDFTG